MTFPEFMRAAGLGDEQESKGTRSQGVYCIQHQNSNLTEEFQPLLKDVDKDLPLATQAFGAPPDAVNFWMGVNNQAVSSLHKDPYENMYCVVAGVKTFTLYPPSDAYWLGAKHFPLAHYEECPTEPSGFKVVPDDSGATVPWIPLDPLDQPSTEEVAHFPEEVRKLRCVSPLHVEVSPGETLYLPALWYHRVGQRVDQAGRVLAVNYWYDMAFGPTQTYFAFLEQAIAVTRSLDEEEHTETTDKADR